MRKVFSILAVAAVVSLAACNSSTTETEGTESDTTMVNDTVPAPPPIDTSKTIIDTSKQM